MPKFSAYMRGEKGIQGDSGQASLLDGIVSSTNELPIVNQQKNYVYYVTLNDGVHLYISEHGSNWQDLGTVTAGFSTKQYTSTSVLPWTVEGTQPTVTITPHGQQLTGLKSFDFYFGIPEGQPAGFSTNQYTSVTSLNWDEPASVEVNVNEDTPNYDKSFTFNFGIPQGRPAGFSTEMGVSVTTLSSTSDATVSVIPDENTPNYAKKFNFEFGIPNGVPAGFGEITTSTLKVNSDAPAEVSISSSGPETAKNFNFTFKIPKGEKGDKGDTLGVYLGINFSSTDLDSTKSIYWNENTLHIKRDDNAKIPIYILNNENNNIIATFEIKQNEIIYEADSKFDGTLFLIAKSNIPKFEIHSCNVISSSLDPYVEAYYPNENDPSTIYLDFYLTKSINGNGGPGTWGEIEGTLSDQEDLINILNGKADLVHDHDNRYFTEDEIISLLNDKASLDSPNLIGIPTAPTADDGTSTNQLATTAFTQKAISNKIDEAPIDNNEYIRKNGEWFINSGGNNLFWGNIRGTIAEQTDLWNALNYKTAIWNIANTFSENVSYSTGAYVIHNNNLYRFTLPHSPGPWYEYDNSLVSVMNELSLKANTSSLGSLAYKNDAPLDNTSYVRKNGAWAILQNSGENNSISTTWGTISGNLNNQTDLQNALNTKVNINSLGNLAYKNDAPSDGYEYIRKNGNWQIATGGSGNGNIVGSAAWGSIIGTLTNQNDLMTALSTKVNKSEVGDLAYLNSIDYNSNKIINKPFLGTMASINDAPSNSKEYVRKNGQWTVSSGGSNNGISSVSWGDIDGFISDQSDLQQSLNKKINNTAIIEEYNPNKTYSNGDIVTKDGKLYYLSFSNFPLGWNKLTVKKLESGRLELQDGDYLKYNNILYIYSNPTQTSSSIYYVINAETTFSTIYSYLNKIQLKEYDSTLNYSKGDIVFKDNEYYQYFNSTEFDFVETNIYNSIQKKADLTLLADIFSSTKVYNINDIFIKNNKLYKVIETNFEKINVIEIEPTGFKIYNGDYASYNGNLYRWYCSFSDYMEVQYSVSKQAAFQSLHIGNSPSDSRYSTLVPITVLEYNPTETYNTDDIIFYKGEYYKYDLNTQDCLIENITVEDLFNSLNYNYDDRYYTKLEVDNKLYEKAPAVLVSSSITTSIVGVTSAIIPYYNIITNLEAIYPVTQSGNGTPSINNIRPFIPLNRFSIKTSTTTTDVNLSYNGISDPKLNTIYGGSFNPITGIATITYGHIDSYSNEILPGIWYSDRDEYVENTTPSEGAEVVYELENSITTFINNSLSNNISILPLRLNPTCILIGLGDSYPSYTNPQSCYEFNIDYNYAQVEDTKTYIDRKDNLKVNITDLGEMAYINDAPSNNVEYVRKNGNWVISSGNGDNGGTAPIWGNIIGSLTTQEDLQNALDLKANISDLGNLANHNTINYETEITNKPLFGDLAYKNDAPSNDKQYVRKNGNWIELISNTSGNNNNNNNENSEIEASWGSISGTISDQTDLQDALNTKISFDIITNEYDSTLEYANNAIAFKDGGLYEIIKNPNLGFQKIDAVKVYALAENHDIDVKKSSYVIYYDSSYSTSLYMLLHNYDDYFSPNSVPPNWIEHIPVSKYDSLSTYSNGEVIIEDDEYYQIIPYNLQKIPDLPPSGFCDSNEYFYSDDFVFKSTQEIEWDFSTTTDAISYLYNNGYIEVVENIDKYNPLENYSTNDIILFNGAYYSLQELSEEREYTLENTTIEKLINKNNENLANYWDPSTFNENNDEIAIKDNKLYKISRKKNRPLVKLDNFVSDLPDTGVVIAYSYYMYRNILLYNNSDIIYNVNGSTSTDTYNYLISRGNFEPIQIKQYNSLSTYVDGDCVFENNTLYRMTNLPTNFKKLSTIPLPASGSLKEGDYLTYTYFNSSPDYLFMVTDNVTLNYGTTTEAYNYLSENEIIENINYAKFYNPEHIYSTGDIVYYYNNYFIIDNLEDTFDFTRTTVKELLNEKIDEAPLDSKEYVRKNGNWIEATGGNGSLSWGAISGTLNDQIDLITALNNKINDAPSDNKIYGRKNGSWINVTNSNNTNNGESYETPTYYVAPSGSDNNNGSQQYPFATIQKAIDECPHLGKGTIIYYGDLSGDVTISDKNIVLQYTYDYYGWGKIIGNLTINGNSQVTILPIDPNINSFEVTGDIQISNGAALYCYYNMDVIGKIEIENADFSILRNGVLTIINNAQYGYGLVASGASFVSIPFVNITADTGLKAQDASIIICTQITGTMSNEINKANGGRIYIGTQIDDAPSNNKIYGRKNGNWVELVSTTEGIWESVTGENNNEWGQIIGNIEDQEDLKEILDKKASVIKAQPFIKRNGTVIEIPQYTTITNIKATYPVTQAGSGTPSSSNIRSFVPAQNFYTLNMYNSTGTGRSSYTGSLPFDIYGGIINMTAGTITLTYEHIASYSGETLPGLWYSDRDVQSSEVLTPSIGAEVVYQLNTPITFSCNKLTSLVPIFNPTYCLIDFTTTNKSISEAIYNFEITYIGTTVETIDTKTYIDTMDATKVNISDIGSMSYENDVPSDNIQYIRKNKAWTPIIASGSTSSNIPIDISSYYPISNLILDIDPITVPITNNTQDFLTIHSLEIYAGNSIFNLSDYQEKYEIPIHEWFGGKLDLANGKQYFSWKKINNYNGESLPGEWRSTSDEYISGTSPSINSIVLYKTETPFQEDTIPYSTIEDYYIECINNLNKKRYKYIWIKYSNDFATTLNYNDVYPTGNIIVESNFNNNIKSYIDKQTSEKLRINNVADIYDPIKDYSLGDIVIKDNQLTQVGQIYDWTKLNIPDISLNLEEFPYDGVYYYLEGNKYYTYDTKLYKTNGTIENRWKLNEIDFTSTSCEAITLINTIEYDPTDPLELSPGEIIYYNNNYYEINSTTFITTFNDITIKDLLNEEINKNKNATWGNITGTLSNQTDLQTTLDAKVNKIDLADEFDISKNYYYGDCVFYNGALYIFTLYKPAGAWDATRVSQLTTFQIVDLKLKDKAYVYGIAYPFETNRSYSPGDCVSYDGNIWIFEVDKAAGDWDWNKARPTAYDVIMTQRLSAKADTSSLGSLAYEDDATSDNKTYGRKNGSWVEVTGGGGGFTAWGSISGTLANQTDLQNLLNNKAPIIIEGERITATSTVVEVPSNALITSIKTTYPVTQSGSGTPSSSNIRPFVAAQTYCTLIRSDSSENTIVANGITLPCDIYGGIVDLIAGVVTLTYGHISSYNGETLQDVWYSDRDIQSDVVLTPTTGAEVVYKLQSPITISCSTLLPAQYNPYWSPTSYIVGFDESRRISTAIYPIEIDYILNPNFADTKTYIDKKFEQIEPPEEARYSFYVDPLNGSDNNDGSFDNPFATIKHTIDNIPRFAKGGITIKSTTITEDINIIGKNINISTNPNGPLTITGDIKVDLKGTLSLTPLNTLSVNGTIIINDNSLFKVSDAFWGKSFQFNETLNICDSKAILSGTTNINLDSYNYNNNIIQADGISNVIINKLNVVNEYTNNGYVIKAQNGAVVNIGTLAGSIKNSHKTSATNFAQINIQTDNSVTT